MRYNMKKTLQQKVNMHEDVGFRLRDLYELKNKYCGDSFAKSFEEYGMPMSCIRLEDNLSRLKALTINNQSQQVRDESVRNTLMDIANYAIMTIIELEIKEEEENHGKNK